jgi:hypothetical protein
MIENRVDAINEYGPLRTWDTQDVNSFDSAFENYRFIRAQGADDDDNITEWDTGAATSMQSMFRGCRRFNQPLRFNTQFVQNMSYMFDGCIRFDQPLRFNTQSVQNMSSMFSNCSAFNQALTFDTRLVNDMSNMFYRCERLNQPLTFNNRQPTIMFGMFHGCIVLNQPLNFGPNAAATHTANMFANCAAFNQPLTVNTQAVDHMYNMFYGCTTFNQPLDFNTAAVIDMQGMFSGCAVFNQPLDFNTVAVIDMRKMFFGCTAFNQPLNFNTVAVLSMSEMFSGCTAFNQTLHRWLHQPTNDTRGIIAMFYGCESFLSPVFTMSLDEYNYSGLVQTPLGQSHVMLDKLIEYYGGPWRNMYHIMLWERNPQRKRALAAALLVEEGRAILSFSREAAIVARRVAAPKNGGTIEWRSSYPGQGVLQQHDNGHDNGRQVRQRLK